jgi:hypothetical protein
LATSGTIVYTLTARDVVEYALRKIGALDITQTADADEAAAALIELEVMLKEWAMKGPYLFTKRETFQTLTSNTASYSLSTAKPIRILEARYRDVNGRDLPMEELTREEYIELPIKSANGIPTTFYFDPQPASWTLYTWPVLLTATTEAIRFTYQRRIEDAADLNNDLDIPQEWLSTVGYALAARLLDDYGIADVVAERVIARSEALLASARAFERDSRVMFHPSMRH